jgi:hypothetical protein
MIHVYDGVSELNVYVCKAWGSIEMKTIMGHCSLTILVLLF